MELTGKCRKEFEGYLNKLRKHETERKFADIDMIIESQGYDFDDLPDSMKYGVLVDYFDSVKIFIQIETRIFDKEHPCYIYSKTVYNRVGCFNTRLEARIESIKKADELRNKVLNKQI